MNVHVALLEIMIQWAGELSVFKFKVSVNQALRNIV